MFIELHDKYDRRPISMNIKSIVSFSDGFVVMPDAGYSVDETYSEIKRLIAQGLSNEIVRKKECSKSKISL